MRNFEIGQSVVVQYACENGEVKTYNGTVDTIIAGRSPRILLKLDNVFDTRKNGTKAQSFRTLKLEHIV